MSGLGLKRFRGTIYRNVADPDVDQDAETPEAVATVTFSIVRELVGIAERNPDGRQVIAVNQDFWSFPLTDSTQSVNEADWVETGNPAKRYEFVTVAKPPGGRGGRAMCQLREKTT